MSLTTDIVVIGLGRRASELVQQRLDEWNVANGIDGFRAEQRLVDISEHAGGLKSLGSLFAACFNYGPHISEWREWFDEAITRFYESPCISLSCEGDQVVFIQGHGWLERSYPDEGA